MLRLLASPLPGGALAGVHGAEETMRGRPGGVATDRRDRTTAVLPREAHPIGTSAWRTATPIFVGWRGDADAADQTSSFGASRIGCHSTSQFSLPATRSWRSANRHPSGVRTTTP